MDMLDLLAQARSFSMIKKVEPMLDLLVQARGFSMIKRVE